MTLAIVAAHSRHLKSAWLKLAGQTAGAVDLVPATTVHSSIKASATVAILVPMLALRVPLIDTALVMTLRFLQRPKSRFNERFLRVFRTDRNHPHHLLEHLAPNRKVVAGVIYGLVLVSCLVALAVTLTRNGPLGWITIAVQVVAIAAIRGFEEEYEGATAII